MVSDALTKARDWRRRSGSERIGAPDGKAVDEMPHYLIKASYTTAGVAGVADKGGTARRDAVGKMVEAAGGTMEAFYFAFGDADVYVIAEMPSDEAAAGIALTINRTDTTTTRTVVLLTPEQIDEAAKLQPDYTPPGG